MSIDQTTLRPEEKIAPHVKRDRLHGGKMILGQLLLVVLFALAVLLRSLA